MFMQIAIGAIGIAVVLMVGYIVIAQVKGALPVPDRAYANSCYLATNNTNTVTCMTTAVPCGPTSNNVSATLTCADISYSSGVNATQTTVFAGFGLIAVGIIVLAAFGLINIFK